MPSQIVCPFCRTSQILADEMLGRIVACPQCKQALTTAPGAVSLAPLAAPSPLDDLDVLAQSAPRVSRRRKKSAVSEWALTAGIAAAAVIGVAVLAVVALNLISSDTTADIASSDGSQPAVTAASNAATTGVPGAAGPLAPVLNLDEKAQLERKTAAEIAELLERDKTLAAEESKLRLERRNGGTNTAARVGGRISQIVAQRQNIADRLKVLRGTNQNHPVAVVASQTPSQSDAQVQQVTIQPASTPLPPGSQGAVAQIAERLKSSVVKITVHGAGRSWSGSGFVVSNTVIATNFHLMASGISAEVKFPNGQQTKVLGFVNVKPTFDQALLRIEPIPMAPTPLKLVNFLPQPDTQVFTFADPVADDFSLVQGIVLRIQTTTQLRNDADFVRHVARFEAGAEWIKTDAAIVPGNIGAPLFNAAGEVVGINTLNITADGSRHLNLAGSALSLQQMVASRDAVLKPLVELPADVDQVALLTPAANTPKIKLPGGGQLDLAMFAPSVSLANRLNTEREEMKYPSGRLYASIGRLQDKLQGPAIGYYENGKIMLGMVYLNGNRHGNLMLLDEEGRLCFAQQYSLGEKHGYLLLCRDGEPHLVQEYREDRLVRSHIVVDLAVARTFEPDEGAEDEELQLALAKVTELQTQMKANEVGIKAMVRELDEEERWLRAIDNSVEARDKIQARINVRRAARALAIERLFRAANPNFGYPARFRVN